MLKIALCDDNSDTAGMYAELINQVAKKHQIKIELSCFYSGESLLFRYMDMPEEVDIVYLDILMDKMDGMETARKLRDHNCKAQIVFLTSYEDYVYEAFDVNAVHYLLKDDTSTSKFEKTFLKAVELVSKKEDELFCFEFDGKTGVVPIRDISHFEICRRLVTIHYDNGKKAKFYASMSQLENKLSDYNFVRSHRSFLVHLPYIAVFQQQELLLKTGEVVPIGTTYMRSLKEAFSEYISYFHIYNKQEKIL
ncbi:MAG TPA: DNA-binding response regulator [Lachnospiraceae bacterium]|nr:DNA-binding response regulator [Lachnospiraceae bacterium]